MCHNFCYSDKLYQCLIIEYGNPRNLIVRVWAPTPNEALDQMFDIRDGQRPNGHITEVELAPLQPFEDTP